MNDTSRRGFLLTSMMTQRRLSVADQRRQLNALGTLTGEDKIVEPLTNNEAAVKIVTRIVIGAAIVLIMAIGGCTMFNTREQEARRLAIANGYVRAITVDGQVIVKPECLPTMDARHSIKP